MATTLPAPVGPMSSRVITSLLDGVGPRLQPVGPLGHDPLDHDLQLALYVLNELHYGGWAGVSDDLEWNADVTTCRLALGDEFERRLRSTLGPGTSVDPLVEAKRLLAIDAVSVSAFLRDRGTIDQVRESMILRSPYQSKEADPHTFAMPRFTGATKRVFTEIQSGEYGVGYRRSHAELFADALDGLGLDATPNAHIDACTGPALAGSNLVTLGAMQRRLRGVVLGQLSLFEMDSVVPNQNMADAVDRLALEPSVRPFFHVHVLADTEHQEMVESAFLTEYTSTEPEQVANMVLGMRAQSLIDHAIAQHCVPRWRQGRSALAAPRRFVDDAVVPLQRRQPARRSARPGHPASNEGSASLTG